MHFEIIPLLLLAALIATAVLIYFADHERRRRFRPFSEADAEALRRAVMLLERSSFAARLTNLVGKPVEFIEQVLPEETSQTIASATTKSLEAAYKVALLTLRNDRHESSQLLHKTLAVASGAAGGALGIASLPIELSVSTIIMLRSILEIARDEGENLSNPEAVLSCIAVFGLGARASDGNGGSDYFASRQDLASCVTEATLYITERGVAEEASPIIARLLMQIGTAFGLVVSEKATAQSIPVIGALGGAAVNYAFIDHFQSIARGHFAVRRLERKYGTGAVVAAYQRFREELKWD